MDAIKQIANFSKELQSAFLKMIMGRNVELTDAGKQKVDSVDQDLFIVSIHEDETMDLMNRNQKVFKGLKLSDIKM